MWIWEQDLFVWSRFPFQTFLDSGLIAARERAKVEGWNVSWEEIDGLWIDRINDWNGMGRNKKFLKFLDYFSSFPPWNEDHR